MGSGIKERLKLAAGLIAAVLITAGAFSYAPSLGIFTGGFLGTCGFILYDRVNRKVWENSVTGQLKKIEDSQDHLAGQVERAGEEISRLKDHVTETALNLRTTPAPEAPRRAMRVAKEMTEPDSMPRALKAGAEPPKRSFDDIVTGQHDLSEAAVKQVVNDALRSQRVELFLQPIVRLPQRKVRFYEMFARVRARPGLYLPAARYMKVAQENRMMQGIDRLLLIEVLDILRETAKLERAAPFFVNVTGSTLKNPAFMQKLLAFLGNYRPLAARLVFEIAQEDFKTLDRPVIEIIKALGKLGCAFSIDNVKDMNFDVQSLLNLKVRYVKITAQDLYAKTRGEQDFGDALRIKRKLEANGISVIAEKIETERQLKELFDFEINYGQGHLFGKPDLQGAYQEKGAKTRRFV